MMNSTTYTIKPNRKNFRPYENPLPVFKPTGFDITFKFLPGGWCSQEDWKGDKDWGDWQKIKGITHFFSGNTKRTVMFAFRFGERQETYEICAYTNDKNGKPQWFGSLLIDAGEQVAGWLKFQDGKAIYYLATEGGSYLTEEHPFEPFKTGREVGTYAGGANNSKGPYGGRAVKAMSIEIDFKINRAMRKRFPLLFTIVVTLTAFIGIFREDFSSAIEQAAEPTQVQTFAELERQAQSMGKVFICDYYIQAVEERYNTIKIGNFPADSIPDRYHQDKPYVVKFPGKKGPPIETLLHIVPAQEKGAKVVAIASVNRINKTCKIYDFTQQEKE